MSDIPLPVAVTFPPTDCAFKVSNPASNGGYGVWGFYLSDDNDRYEAINSSLIWAGYGGPGMRIVALKDSNNSLYTVTLDPIAGSLDSRMIEATGVVGDVLLINVDVSS